MRWIPVHYYDRRQLIGDREVDVWVRVGPGDEGRRMVHCKCDDRGVWRTANDGQPIGFEVTHYLEIDKPPRRAAEEHKVVAGDMYARDSVADVLVAEGIPNRDLATRIVEALNAPQAMGPERWMRVMPQSVRLQRGMEDLV